MVIHNNTTIIIVTRHFVAICSIIAGITLALNSGEHWWLSIGALLVAIVALQYNIKE